MTIEAETLREHAPAKVNLFLHVGQKRADGYHALQSLVAFAQVGDELTFEAGPGGFWLFLNGPFARGLSPGEGNLVAKAARALDPKVTRDAKIVLTKNLPISSGIGGGSADCAAALRGLAKLWGLDLPQDELLAIAAGLGSDVPVCIESGVQWMEGRGETLTALPPLPDMAMVLVNPGVSVSTPKVFAKLKERRGTDLPLPPKFENAAELIGYLKDTANDLEAPARSIAPEIGEVLAVLAAQPGVLLARMSGSGATCFALFDDDAAAVRTTHALRERHSHWWTSATRIAALPL